MIMQFATSTMHQKGGGICQSLGRRGPTSVVVVLEDGGIVAIVSVVVATLLERLSGETGLKEQVAPAIGK
jgi:hypothetical protein